MNKKFDDLKLNELKGMLKARLAKKIQYRFETETSFYPMNVSLNEYILLACELADYYEDKGPTAICTMAVGIMESRVTNPIPSSVEMAELLVQAIKEKHGFENGTFFSHDSNGVKKAAKLIDLCVDFSLNYPWLMPLIEWRSKTNRWLADIEELRRPSPSNICRLNMPKSQRRPESDNICKKRSTRHIYTFNN